MKRFETVLRELLYGILILGIFIQAAFIWFFPSKLMFTLGLWVGIGLAVFMAIHMDYSINRGVDLPADDSGKYMTKMVSIRMLVVLVIFVGMCILNADTGLAILLGMLTLKFSAYLQPQLHKLIEKRKKKGG